MSALHAAPRSVPVPQLKSEPLAKALTEWRASNTVVDNGQIAGDLAIVKHTREVSMALARIAVSGQWDGHRVMLDVELLKRSKGFERILGFLDLFRDQVTYIDPVVH